MHIRTRHFEERHSATVAIISTLATGGTAIVRRLASNEANADDGHLVDLYDSLNGTLISTLYSLYRFTFSIKYPCFAFIAGATTKSIIELLSASDVSDLSSIAIGTCAVGLFFYGFKKSCERSDQSLLRAAEYSVRDRITDPRITMA